MYINDTVISKVNLETNSVQWWTELKKHLLTISYWKLYILQGASLWAVGELSPGMVFFVGISILIASLSEMEGRGNESDKGYT